MVSRPLSEVLFGLKVMDGVGENEGNCITLIGRSTIMIMCDDIDIGITYGYWGVI